MPDITVNLALVGMVFLLIYVFVDLIRNRKHNRVKRVIFYSFLFYLIVVIQLTTGGISFPPEENPVFRVQIIPFYFIYDWFLVRNMGDLFFWNAVRLSLYNLIMLLPLGVYLAILYNIKRLKKVILIIFMTSLTIEIYQFILGYYGFVFARSFNIDDLLLNTLGGALGYIVFGWLNAAWMTHKNKDGIINRLKRSI